MFKNKIIAYLKIFWVFFYLNLFKFKFYAKFYYAFIFGFKGKVNVIFDQIIFVIDTREINLI